MPKIMRSKANFYLNSILTILATTELLGFAMVGLWLTPEAIAQPWLLAQLSSTKFGLGLPKTASTGGGTRLSPDQPDLENPIEESSPRLIPKVQKRDNMILRGGEALPNTEKPPAKKQPLPRLILITPEDGARTASSQPLLYWFFTHDVNNSPKNIMGKLSLFEGESAIAVFQTDLKISSGLSSFKLPIASALQPSKTYRWQLTIPDSQEVIASGWILYTPPDAKLQKALNHALTNRDRAKLYAEAGYWFEAIDLYTRWLNFKPKDLQARTARNEILKSGFITNKNLDFDSFIALLNADATKSPVNKSL